jgi:hypothetical protein
MEVRSECKIFVGNLVGYQTVGVRMILKQVSVKWSVRVWRELN